MIQQGKDIEIVILLCVLGFHNEFLKLLVMNIMIMPVLN